MVVQPAHAPLPVAPAVGALSLLFLVLVDVPVNMQYKFQQSLFMNPRVLQFINSMVDISAACSSWYAQCTLCSRPCSGDGCHAPVVVQRQVSGWGVQKLWSPAVAVLLGVAQCLVRLWIHVCIILGGFFWSPRALTGVSARGLGFGADAGSSLSGVGPPG